MIIQPRSINDKTPSLCWYSLFDPLCAKEQSYYPCKPTSNAHQQQPSAPAANSTNFQYTSSQEKYRCQRQLSDYGTTAGGKVNGATTAVNYLMILLSLLLFLSVENA